MLRPCMARRNRLRRCLGRGLCCLPRFACRLQTRLNLINQTQIADKLHAASVNLMSFAVCHVGHVCGMQIRNCRGAPLYPECLGNHAYRDHHRNCAVSKARLRQWAEPAEPCPPVRFSASWPEGSFENGRCQIRRFCNRFKLRQTAHQRAYICDHGSAPCARCHMSLNLRARRGRKCSVEILGQQCLGFFAAPVVTRRFHCSTRDEGPFPPAALPARCGLD